MALLFKGALQWSLPPFFLNILLACSQETDERIVTVTIEAAGASIHSDVYVASVHSIQLLCIMAPLQLQETECRPAPWPEHFNLKSEHVCQHRRSLKHQRKNQTLMVEWGQWHKVEDQARVHTLLWKFQTNVCQIKWHYGNPQILGALDLNG